MYKVHNTDKLAKRNKVTLKKTYKKTLSNT